MKKKLTADNVGLMMFSGLRKVYKVCKKQVFKEEVRMKKAIKKALTPTKARGLKTYKDLPLL